MRSFRLSTPYGREATLGGYLLALVSLVVTVGSGYLWLISLARASFFLLPGLLLTPLLAGATGAVFHLFVGILLGWIGTPVWKPRPRPDPSDLPPIDKDGSKPVGGSGGG